MSKPLTYADVGVDIDKANAFVQTIKEVVNNTSRPGVMGEIGGFGGLYSLKTNDMKDPVLVSSTDGVGTKLKIAFMMDKHDTIGIDLVAMCVNDIVVQGAKPLFFLDYLSIGKLKTGTATQIVKGIADGCIQAKCALIGGETAEMPGFYKEDEYDLAGFSVGIVEDSKIVDGSEIHIGSQVIGIASSGLHSNGYSLVRNICFDVLGLDVDSHVPELGRSIGEELLIPTKIYSETIQRLVKDLPILGLAHITGGGIVENILRVIPEICSVVMKNDSWEVAPIFKFLKDAGKISDTEMMRTFNNGIGMVVVVPEKATQDVLDMLNAMNEKAFVIGEIIEKKYCAQKIIWR